MVVVIVVAVVVVIVVLKHKTCAQEHVKHRAECLRYKARISQKERNRSRQPKCHVFGVGCTVQCAVPAPRVPPHRCCGGRADHIDGSGSRDVGRGLAPVRRVERPDSEAAHAQPVCLPPSDGDRSRAAHGGHCGGAWGTTSTCNRVRSSVRR